MIANYFCEHGYPLQQPNVCPQCEWDRQKHELGKGCQTQVVGDPQLGQMLAAVNVMLNALCEHFDVSARWPSLPSSEDL